jgi:hypothetical protein
MDPSGLGRHVAVRRGTAAALPFPAGLSVPLLIAVDDEPDLP